MKKPLRNLPVSPQKHLLLFRNHVKNSRLMKLPLVVIGLKLIKHVHLNLNICLRVVNNLVVLMDLKFLITHPLKLLHKNQLKLLHKNQLKLLQKNQLKLLQKNQLKLLLKNQLKLPHKNQLNLLLISVHLNKILTITVLNGLV